MLVFMFALIRSVVRSVLRLIDAIDNRIELEWCSFKQSFQDLVDKDVTFSRLRDLKVNWKSTVPTGPEAAMSPVVMLRAQPRDSSKVLSLGTLMTHDPATGIKFVKPTFYKIGTGSLVMRGGETLLVTAQHVIHQAARTQRDGLPFIVARSPLGKGLIELDDDWKTLPHVNVAAWENDAHGNPYPVHGVDFAYYVVPKAFGARLQVRALKIAKRTPTKGVNLLLIRDDGVKVVHGSVMRNPTQPLILNHDANTTRGDSGAPLYSDGKLVGIHIGAVKTVDGMINAAQDVVTLNHIAENQDRIRAMEVERELQSIGSIDEVGPEGSAAGGSPPKQSDAVKQFERSEGNSEIRKQVREVFAPRKSARNSRRQQRDGTRTYKQVRADLLKRENAVKHRKNSEFDTQKSSDPAERWYLTTVGADRVGQENEGASADAVEQFIDDQSDFRYGGPSDNFRSNGARLRNAVSCHLTLTLCLGTRTPQEEKELKAWSKYMIQQAHQDLMMHQSLQTAVQSKRLPLLDASKDTMTENSSFVEEKGPESDLLVKQDDSSHSNLQAPTAPVKRKRRKRGKGTRKSVTDSFPREEEQQSVSASCPKQRPGAEHDQTTMLC
jgi:hypothetical protein